MQVDRDGNGSQWSRHVDIPPRPQAATLLHARGATVMFVCLFRQSVRQTVSQSVEHAPEYMFTTDTNTRLY